jgi:hypothetical protein
VGNGDTINGEIITYQEGLCVFRSNYGAPFSIPIEKIVSISTDKKVKISTRAGEVIVGQLAISEANKSLLSTAYGQAELSTSDIIKITPAFENASESGEHKDADAYGERTKAKPPLEFLSGSAVLLDEGVNQIELGLDYRRNRENYPLPSVGPFENYSYTARLLRLDSTWRRGWANGIESFVTVPFTYTYIEQVSSNEYVRDTDEWAFGDISVGLQYELVNESASSPAIALSASISAPTGKKKYYSATDDWKDPLNNSQGHWQTMLGLSMVRTTDPAILFSGINVFYSRPATIDGYDVEPGLGFSGYFGVGLSVNERLSLGTRFSYSYFADSKVDGQEIHGSDSEGMDLTFSASFRPQDKWVLTPEVTFSLNSDAGAPSLALRLNRDF